MLKKFLKKWLFLFIVTVFSLIIALKTGIGFFYLAFWFLIAVFSLTFLWVSLEYLSANIVLERHMTAKTREGDVIEIKTAVKNRGLLPFFNLIVEDYLPCAAPDEQEKRVALDFLGVRASPGIRYQCRCPQRGKYNIGPLRVYFFDPLGIFFLKKTYNTYSEVYVFPKTFTIRKFPPLLKGVFPWFGIETTHISGDDDEFYGIREYKEGDPLKRIHWVSTARKNKLIARQFQRQAFFRATLIFNLQAGKNFGQGQDTIAEYTVRIAASVAQYLVQNNVALEIIAHAGSIMRMNSNKGPEYLDEVFKFLSLAQAESRVSLGEVFEESARYIPNDTTLIVIMQDRDWEYLSMILPLKKRNVSLIPLILVSSTFLYSLDRHHEVLDDVRIKLTQSFNFTPLVFSRGDNLEEAFLKY